MLGLLAAALLAQVCPVGQAVTLDTAGHCCWPGQAWSRSRAVCVGVPNSCPAGLRAEGDSCVVDCPVGLTANEDTQGHCCWPGQVWSKSRAVCVGVPQCAAGFVVAGEACVAVARTAPSGGLPASPPRGSTQPGAQYGAAPQPYGATQPGAQYGAASPSGSPQPYAVTQSGAQYGAAPQSGTPQPGAQYGTGPQPYGATQTGAPQPYGATPPGTQYGAAPQPGAPQQYGATQPAAAPQSGSPQYGSAPRATSPAPPTVSSKVTPSDPYLDYGRFDVRLELIGDAAIPPMIGAELGFAWNIVRGSAGRFGIATNAGFLAHPAETFHTRAVVLLGGEIFGGLRLGRGIAELLVRTGLVAAGIFQYEQSLWLPKLHVGSSVFLALGKTGSGLSFGFDVYFLSGASFVPHLGFVF